MYYLQKGEYLLTRGKRNGKGQDQPYLRNIQAYEVWQTLQKQINRLIEKIVHFNVCYSYEDYCQEAFIACIEAVQRYDTYIRKTPIPQPDTDSTKNGWIRFNNRNTDTCELGVNTKTVMRLDVFAYWYLQKRLYRMADMDEVIYNVYDEQGNFKTTVSNSEYRKIKSMIKSKGFSVSSSNIFRDIQAGNDNGNGRNNRKREIADFSKDEHNQLNIRKTGYTWDHE